MARPGISVRRGTPQDAARLATFAARSFSATFAPENKPEDIEAYVREAFSQGQTESELRCPDASFLLAERDGVLVGYAKLREDTAQTGSDGQQSVELQRIYVDAGHVGTGVGKILMQESIRQALDRGYTTLWLGVWEHNSSAIAFYRNTGFEVVGSHEFMLGQDRQTDLVMELALP